MLYKQGGRLLWQDPSLFVILATFGDSLWFLLEGPLVRQEEGKLELLLMATQLETMAKIIELCILGYRRLWDRNKRPVSRFWWWFTRII